MKVAIFMLLITLSFSVFSKPLKQELSDLVLANANWLKERDALIDNLSTGDLEFRETFLVKQRINEINESLKENQKQQDDITKKIEEKEPNQWDVFRDF